jgi:hypothetical protein
VQREIDGVRLRRKDAEASLESTIATLRNSLEFLREQGMKERDEKIVLHRPRPLHEVPPAPHDLPDLPIAQAR